MSIEFGLRLFHDQAQNVAEVVRALEQEKTKNQPQMPLPFSMR